MMLTEEQIADFKAIWLQEFEEEISDEDAHTEAIALLNFFEAVFFKGNKEKGTSEDSMDESLRPE